MQFTFPGAYIVTLTIVSKSDTDPRTLIAGHPFIVHTDEGKSVIQHITEYIETHRESIALLGELHGTATVVSLNSLLFDNEYEFETYSLEDDSKQG